MAEGEQAPRRPVAVAPQIGDQPGRDVVEPPTWFADRKDMRPRRILAANFGTVQALDTAFVQIEPFGANAHGTDGAVHKSTTPARYTQRLTVITLVLNEAGTGAWLTDTIASSQMTNYFIIRANKHRCKMRMTS